MSDLRKVYPGDRMQIPASAYNAFVDAARDYRDRAAGLERDPERFTAQSGIVLVRNDTGSPQAQFAVLGIAGPVVTPLQNGLEFKNRVALSGVVPGDEHNGRFVVLAEPIPAGEMGRAYVSGVCLVRVTYTWSDSGKKNADITAGQTATLGLSDNGSAAILWREDAWGNEAWAVVRLGNAVPDLAPPISFWPTLRRNTQGQMRLYVAPGRIRIRGQAAWTHYGGEFVPFWNHCVYVVRNYPDCGGYGSTQFYYGPEPDETIDRAVVVLCRVTGGTDNYGLQIHHVGDVELYDVVRRVRVDAYEEEPEEDNVPPVANAGADRTIVKGATLYFDGRASSDNVGIAEFIWTSTFGTLYGEQPAFTFHQAGEYLVTLTVKDAKGNSASDTMTVTVVDPEAGP